MFKNKVRFVDGSSLDYTSEDKEEPNKIKFSLDGNVSLGVIREGRTIIVAPQNILLVDITEVKND